MKPSGYVTMGWNMKPVLEWIDKDGKTWVHWGAPDCDRNVFAKEHYIEGQEWPVDPVTKEKLPIAYERDWFKKEEGKFNKWLKKIQGLVKEKLK